MTTYYETLNVPPTATPEDIKKAYRDMAKKKHPDAGGSKEEFQEISRAWMILRDPIKRERYDRTGSEEPDKFEEMFNALIVEAFGRSETPIQTLKDKLKRDAEGLETMRSKAKIDHEQFTIRVEKFNRKNPDNNLIYVFQSKSKQMEEEIDEINLALDTAKRMIDRLKTYKEEKKTKAARNNQPVGPTADALKALFDILASKSS